MKEFLESLKSPAMEALKNIYQTVNEGIQNCLSTIATQVNLQKIPESAKQAREENCRTWLHFGWILGYNVPLESFVHPPETKEEADRLFNTWYNINDVRQMFNEFKPYILIPGDADDALFCYTNGRYRPCVYMLLSLIEKCLLTFYNSVSATIVKNKGIVNQYKENSEKFRKFDSTILTYCYCYSISICLEEIYRSSDGFIDDDEKFCVPSRNYFMHGYSKRACSKEDCLNLIILLNQLYNRAGNHIKSSNSEKED